MGIAAVNGGFQPLNASLQTAKVAQSLAVQSGDGDGDSDDNGGVSTSSDRLMDIKA